MLVYRYLEKQELDNIISRNISKVGKEYQKFDGKLSNNFKYEENVSYIHFFAEKPSMEYIRRIKFDKNGQFYFCVFDVPKEDLILGLGTYHSNDMKQTVQVKEYIFDTKKLKKEYLVGFQKDRTRKQDNIKFKNQQLNFFKGLISSGKTIKNESELKSSYKNSNIKREENNSTNSFLDGEERSM